MFGPSRRIFHQNKRKWEYTNHMKLRGLFCDPKYKSSQTSRNICSLVTLIIIITPFEYAQTNIIIITIFEYGHTNIYGHSVPQSCRLERCYNDYEPEHKVCYLNFRKFYILNHKISFNLIWFDQFDNENGVRVHQWFNLVEINHKIKVSMWRLHTCPSYPTKYTT